MTRRRRRFGVAACSSAAVFVVVAVLIAVLATRGPASEELVQSPLVGKSAPALSGRTLDGRATIRLSVFERRHDWVLVNFFASWCTVCQAEAPQLEQFMSSHPDGITPVLIGVLYGDTVADGIRFQRAEGATWPAIVDPGGAIASGWGVGSLPHTYLIAPNGKIVACILGGMTASQLDRLLLAKAQAFDASHNRPSEAA